MVDEVAGFFSRKATGIIELLAVDGMSSMTVEDGGDGDSGLSLEM